MNRVNDKLIYFTGAHTDSPRIAIACADLLRAAGKWDELQTIIIRRPCDVWRSILTESRAGREPTGQLIEGEDYRFTTDEMPLEARKTFHILADGRRCYSTHVPLWRCEAEIKPEENNARRRTTRGGHSELFGV